MFCVSISGVYHVFRYDSLTFLFCYWDFDVVVKYSTSLACLATEILLLLSDIRRHCNLSLVNVFKLWNNDDIMLLFICIKKGRLTQTITWIALYWVLGLWCRYLAFLLYFASYWEFCVLFIYFRSLLCFATN